MRQTASGEKSKIRQLLEFLDREGEMDANLLQERTGFPKPLIAATMCCARDRGMVKIRQRDQDGNGVRHSEQRRTRRGQIYTFVSYTSVTKEDATNMDTDPWPQDLRHTLESVFMPGVRQIVAKLDGAIQDRRIHQPK